MVAEELPGEVRGDDKSVGIVKADHIGIPTDVVYVLKQRRIRHEGHDILVAFHADHEHRFTQSAVKLACRADRDGEFAHEDLGSAFLLAGVGVELMQVFRKEFGGIVEMFVGYFCGQAVLLGVRVGDVLNPGEAGLELVIAHFIADIVFFAVVFVADLDVGHLEGIRVTGGRADLAPLAVGRGGRVFDGVYGFLQKRLEFFAFKELRSAALAGQAAVEHIQGFHVQVFADLQVFVESQAVGGAVVPHEDVGGAFPDRADRVGEAHGGFIGEAFYDAATGEAQEAGVDSLEDLHEVFAHAVAVVGVGGHKGRKAELDLAAAAGRKHQAGVLVALDGDKGGVIAAEGSGGDVESRLAVDFACFALDGHGDFDRGRDRFGEHIEVINLPGFLRHAGEADPGANFTSRETRRLQLSLSCPSRIISASFAYQAGMGV